MADRLYLEACPVQVGLRRVPTWTCSLIFDRRRPIFCCCCCWPLVIICRSTWPIWWIYSGHLPSILQCIFLPFLQPVLITFSRLNWLGANFVFSFLLFVALFLSCRVIGTICSLICSDYLQLCRRFELNWNCWNDLHSSSSSPPIRQSSAPVNFAY